MEIFVTPEDLKTHRIETFSKFGIPTSLLELVVLEPEWATNMVVAGADMADALNRIKLYFSGTTPCPAPNSELRSALAAVDEALLSYAKAQCSSTFSQ
jgi:hypothetical protein